MPEPQDHYKVLQVDSEADPEIIQAAFRRLAQKFHPDVMPGPDAAGRMASINAAWEVLRDPERRGAYDRERAHAARSSPADILRRSEPGRGSATGGAATGGSRATSGATSGGPGATSGPGSGSASDAAGAGTATGVEAAGPPPGDPSGSVLTFGRYAGWSLGEIARRDLEYVEWLDRMPIGRPYRAEIDPILRRAGRRKAPDVEASERHGLFRRR